MQIGHAGAMDGSSELAVEPEQTAAGDWTARLRGHDYAVRVDGSWKGNRVVVRIDGRVVRDKVLHGERETITLGRGRTLTLRISPLGALKRATIRDGDVDLDLDAPAGTKAARLQAWGREHPRMYAVRHVLTSGGGILLGLIGINWLIRLLEPYLPQIPLPDLPDIPWPDLPDIPWPQIDLPKFSLPQIDAPDWVDLIVVTSKYWMPLLLAVLVAIWEVRRQRRQRAYRDSLAGEGTEVTGTQVTGTQAMGTRALEGTDGTDGTDSVGGGQTSGRQDVAASPPEHPSGDESGGERGLEEDRRPRQLVDGQVRQRGEGGRVDEGLRQTEERADPRDEERPAQHEPHEAGEPRHPSEQGDGEADNEPQRRS